MDGFYVAKFKKISDKSKEEMKAESNNGEEEEEEDEGMDVEEFKGKKAKKTKKCVFHHI